MILATAFTMLIGVLFGFKSTGDSLAIDIKGIIIFTIIAIFAVVFKKVEKKAVSPIFLILLSAGLGMALYAV